MPICKVVLIEDDIISAELLKAKVNAIEGFSCEAVFGHPRLFLESDSNPQIILLDVMMPEMSGLEAIELILKKCPEAAIVINSVREDPDTIFTALKKGALGYIYKKSKDLNFEDVLKTIANGGGYMTPEIALKVMGAFRQPRKSAAFEDLTPREEDITSGILEGLSYKMIASRYDISLNTVRMNIKNIYRKLKINSKAELFQKAGGTSGPSLA